MSFRFSTLLAPPLLFVLTQILSSETAKHGPRGAKPPPPATIFKFKLLKSLSVNDQGGKNIRTIAAGKEFTLLDHESFQCEFWETFIEVDNAKVCAPYSILANAINLQNTPTRDLLVHSGTSAQAVKVEGEEESQVLRLSGSTLNLPPKSVLRMVVLPTNQSPCPDRSVLVEHIYRDVNDPSSGLEEEEDRHPLYCISYKWLMKGVHGSDPSISPAVLADRDKAMSSLIAPSHASAPPPEAPSTPKPSTNEPFKAEIRKLNKKSDIKLADGKKIEVVAGTRVQRLPPSTTIKCEKGWIPVKVVKLNKNGCIAYKDFLASVPYNGPTSTPGKPSPSGENKPPANPGPTKLKNLHVRPDGHLSSRGHAEPQYYLNENPVKQRIRAYYSEDERDPYRLLDQYNKNKTSTTSIPKLGATAMSPNREISQAFAQALDQHLEVCVKSSAGVSNISGQIEVSHVGIKKDSKHSSRSLHALGRAMDMTGIYFTADGKEQRFVLAYGNLARMKAPENRNTLEKKQYDFWVKFSACMKDKGFSARTFDKTHPKHVHIGWPSKSLLDNYGIWMK